MPTVGSSLRIRLLGPLEVGSRALADLRPDPVNPRRISDDKLEALTRSLRPVRVRPAGPLPA